jgi:hypothetical protein
MTQTPEVKYEQMPSGIALKIEQKPDGPLVVIDQDGRVTVTRGPFDEAGKLFWDAVNINGVVYRDRILQLERMVMALSTDPFKAIVHGGAYEVRSKMTKKIPLVDVNAVLDTINEMAKRAIQ